MPTSDNRPNDGPVIVEPPTFDFAVELLRPQDLLVLRFEYINFDLVLDVDSPRLVRINDDDAASVKVYFPPQNIAEQAFFQADANLPIEDDEDPDSESGSEPLTGPPIRSRLSGPSRLVFSIPEEITEIPYDVASLLDWSRFQLMVHPTARPPELSSSLLNPSFKTALVPLSKLATAASDEVELHLGEQNQPASNVLSAKEPAISLDLDEQNAFRGPGQKAGVVPDFLKAFPLKPKISEPEPNQTAIEMPYRLIMSPHRSAAWAHAGQVVMHNGRAELWHTRLAVSNEADPENPIEEDNDTLRTLRAIWSPDYPLEIDNIDSQERVDFRMSLDERDRYELVRLMSDYKAQQGGFDYIPQPVNAKRFMLTALGAWMDVYGKWDPLAAGEKHGKSLSVEAWRHRSTMARDNYVRVVRGGYLWPFGHRASLVKITERTFVPRGSKFNPQRAAYLQQRMYLVVREPEKWYPVSGQDFDGRTMPFKFVRISTMETPSLDNPQGSPLFDSDDFPNLAADSAFWPQVGGADFLFQLVAEDDDGQRIEFSAPLAFVDNNAGRKPMFHLHTPDSYHDARRTRAMQGQNIAYAESNRSGDTSLETITITFGAGKINGTLPVGYPRFFPTVVNADVRVPAVQQFLGDDQPVKVTWHETYQRDGFSGSNQGGIFLKLADDSPAQTLNFPADKAGGVVTPNFSTTALSRELGPVGGADPTTLDSGTFDPIDFFGGQDAKILGGLSLTDILAAGGTLENTPRLTNWFDEAENSNKTELIWETGGLEDFAVFQTRNDTHLRIEALLSTTLDSSAETNFRISGTLRDFDMDFLGMIVVTFGEFSFTAESGQKLKVDPHITNVAFGGPLEFINALSEDLSDSLPLIDSGTGAFLDVSPAGLVTGFTLAIPRVEVGIFSLTDLAFTSALDLPFDGKAVRIRFDFAQRQKPMLLSVYMFAGTAYLGLAVGLDGVEMLEAALEFGGNLSFDIGIASGGVFVLAGIYFRWEITDTGKCAELTGYLRLGGHLSVLGLISLSLEFYMGLTYNFGTKKVIGRATLTVKVEVLFFSASVKLTVERRFAGSGGDPLFLQMMPQQEFWDTYCDAFAVYP